MNKPILSMFFACVLFFSCGKKDDAEPVIDNTPEHIKQNFELVWSDEFNGTSLDTTKWNYRQDGGIRKLGTVNRETISIEGGNLLITVFKDNNGVYNIGQVSTEGIFEQKYGYFECRAKMQKSLGPHTAFWLQSQAYGATNNPTNDGVEIDIFEYHRKAPTTVYHNLHWNGYGDDHKTEGWNVWLPEISDGYHTFGLEWNEHEYIFYVNGKKTWTTQKAISKRDQFMILSAELSGWGGEPSTGKFPDAVYFDYVRVYKEK